MRWKFVWMATCVFASTVAAGADCRQGLSGEWTREATAGSTPDEAYRAEGSGWSDRIRVAQDSGKVTVESFWFARTDMQPPLRFSYLPGQGETENAVMVGQGAQRQVSAARWSDCRLVITTRYPGSDGASAEASVTQTVWLESETTLVVETARGAAQPNRTVYRRAAVAGGT